MRQRPLTVAHDKSAGRNVIGKITSDLLAAVNGMHDIYIYICLLLMHDDLN